MTGPRYAMTIAGPGELTWSRSSNRFAWTAYLGREPRLSDAPEYAAPARRKDVAGLPPAWIGVGDLELFYDENVAYAERLTAAGVPCELVTVPGMYHAANGLAQKALSMQNFHASMVEHSAYLPGRGGVKGVQFAGDVGAAGRVDDFLHTTFGQFSHSSLDHLRACDHCHPIGRLIEKDAIAFGEMRDVTLVGEEMAFAFRSERLERVAPDSAARHGVDGVRVRQPT